VSHESREGADPDLALDFSLRVGEVLLSSGAGAADVVATMRAVSWQYGLRAADVDVTFTSLSMSVRTRSEDPPVLQVRQVIRRVIDYDHLTQVDRLVADVLGGSVDLREARTRLGRIVSSPPKTPRWAITLGWGVMCAGVVLLLGGNVAVMVIAFASAACIDRLQLTMSRRRLPAFYQQVAGGMLAAVVALQVSSATTLDPSRIVTANIVMLLAGIGFMGALQDALTGFYVTAGARATEALMATAGIIAGVSGGLSLAHVLGQEPAKIVPGASGFGDLPVVALGSAICAGAFAFATYAPSRALLPIAVVGAVAMVVARTITGEGITQAWATAVAAVFVGLVSYGLARHTRIPPLVVVIPAVVPMLPGLSIYRGLALLNQGGARASEGLLALVAAASIAIALASGVLFGGYVAQPLAREARKVEARLSGPRLVGPLSLRSHRPRRKGPRQDDNDPSV